MVQVGIVNAGGEYGARKGGGSMVGLMGLCALCRYCGQWGRLTKRMGCFVLSLCRTKVQARTFETTDKTVCFFGQTHNCIFLVES